MNSLTTRMILIGLAIHAVLLPLLFNGLLYIVAQSHKEGFVNDVRKYSRFIADVFESGDIINDRDRVVNLLDSAILGSGGVYAEVVEGVIHTRSELQPYGSAVEYKEDYTFGDHGDDVYFVSVTLNLPGRNALLRLGFDERPTIQQIKLARTELVVVLVSYLVVSIIVLVYVAMRMARPLRKLQNASRRIANGKHTDQLQVDSGISEINELALDLESMRSELVGMNMSLQTQIAEIEAADREREMLEGKLRQVDKMETVGVLAGGISHEFNNILLPIFLYTEQAMHDLPEDSPVRAHLEKVLKSSRRAKSLVQQILTFSRLSGEQEFQPVDILPVVQEASELLRALLPSTIDFRRNLGSVRSMVMADRNQIHQLVVNLGSNAYQAIGKSKGTITVSLDHVVVDEKLSTDYPLLQPGGYIKLSVGDTGHGIDRSRIDRIFEPFYTTRAVGEGTGLGLSVVHGIVLSHKGDIIVESEPGAGTEFHVYLPEYTGHADAASENMKEQAGHG